MAGPAAGPLRRGDAPGALGVFDRPESGMPIGIARGHTWVELDDRRPVEVFRLVIGKTPLDGHWIVVEQRLVRLGDAAGA